MPNMNFAFAPNSSPGDTTAKMVLTIFDSTNTQIAQQLIQPATAASNWTFTIPFGTGYKATLVAYNAQGLTDASPPSVTFNVNAPPPPPAPGDPTLNPPTQAS